jgi:hypothetical protein
MRFSIAQLSAKAGRGQPPSELSYPQFHTEINGFYLIHTLGYALFFRAVAMRCGFTPRGLHEHTN